MSTLDFVKEQLNRPGVVLRQLSADTGISERLLSMLKAGDATNTSVERIERLASHLGYSLKPVRKARAGKSRTAA